MGNFREKLYRYSWLLIPLAFALLITKWAVLMNYANENRPEEIDIHGEQTAAESAASGEESEVPAARHSNEP